MDKEAKKRRQTIKLIITEIIMVVAIVFTVIILTLLAMGYNVNKDGELGQSGLVQIKSIPTGVTVTIDDEQLLAHTNTSRMLPAGEHQVKLTKEGYDTWSKKIMSESGWLLKLDYARLFLTNRTMEKVREYDEELSFISADNIGEQIVYSTGGSMKWKILNIRGDEVQETQLDVTEYLSSSEVKEVIWNENNDKLLVKTKNGDTEEWALINAKNLKESINLSQQFKANFSDIKFLTADGQRLMALEDGNMRSISVSDKTISGVLATNVSKFTSEEMTVFYQVKTAEKSSLMLYQEGAEDILVTDFPKDSIIRLAVSEYLGKKYIAFSINNRVFIYEGAYPTVERTLSDMELIIESDIDFIPEKMVVWTEGRLIMMQKDREIEMFDAELGELYHFKVENDEAFFLDKYLLGTVENGKLVVRDFDGGNKRELASAQSFGRIAKNHKWLYYNAVVEGKTNLFRERIIE